MDTAQIIAYHLFQSSSGPREPDVLCRQCTKEPSRSFNPRPALASRTSLYAALTARAGLFQSSSGPREPDVIGTEVRLMAEFLVSILVRPSRAGRHRVLRSRPDQACVSILVRPSRAGRPSDRMRCVSAHSVSILVRPSRAGRRPDAAGLAQEQLVSILVRPSRAGRRGGRAVRPLCQCVSILVRPSRAGRPPEMHRDPLSLRFQSSSGPREPDVA